MATKESGTHEQQEQAIYTLVLDHFPVADGTSFETRWNGELRVAPVASAILDAAGVLLESKCRSDTEPNYPATVYGADGNTAFGVRYAEINGEVVKDGVEIVTQAPNRIHGFDARMRLIKQGKNIRKHVFVVDEGSVVPITPRRPTEFLARFADVVSASRWMEVFGYIRRNDRDVVSTEVEQSLQERIEGAEKALAEATSDLQMYRLLRDYHGRSAFPASMEVVSRIIDTTGDEVAIVRGAANELTKIEALRLALDTAAKRVGRQGLQAVGIEVEYLVSGLKSPIAYDLDALPSLRKFAANYAEIYLGAPKAPELD